MPSRSAIAPVALAVGVLLISMISYQCGASLAKHLFPEVGAQGATAYRLGLSALILLAWLIAVALRQATGSATVATTTTAGIVAPVVAGLSVTHKDRKSVV